MTTFIDQDTPLGQEVAALRVHRAGALDVPRIAEALRYADWLGEPIVVDGLPPETTRYLTDLVFPLPPDGRLLAFRKAALVDLGPVRLIDTVDPDCPAAFDMAIAWRSASLAPLFPVFAGRLVVRSTGIGLDGQYAPPGGVVGRAADRILLHTAARGTARWFLDHLVAEARGAHQTLAAIHVAREASAGSA
jgi:hypothetical protein